MSMPARASRWSDYPRHLMRRSRAVLPDLSPSCTIPPDARTVNKYALPSSVRVLNAVR
jgi:hypothetical protein